MVNFTDAARCIRTMRVLTRIRHSHESARYRLELSKRSQPAPISLPQWMFEEK